MSTTTTTTTTGAFPTDEVGDLSDTNSMLRLNYFNGRFLTAEALRTEQGYWDARARLVAQIHPSGIAWGLSILSAGAGASAAVSSDAEVAYTATAASRRALAARAKRGRTRVAGAARSIRGALAESAVSSSATTTGPNAGGSIDALSLQPGLAFDGLGRPILVESAFDFSISELLSKYEQEPVKLTSTRGLSFVDCRCVITPTGGVTGAAAVEPGPYLLVINPEETPEGEAKVYGTSCTTTTLCESNGWRGGFGLTLARMSDGPIIEDGASVSEIRGILSAWYFDTYEHSLNGRHASPFPSADTFCYGPGPSARYGEPVPLAMVYIGAGRTAQLIDPWIPRRPIVSTASAVWSTLALGAPSPSAAVARVHQFQCQLAEVSGAGPTEDANLYQLGFRHIPPFGFLPVDLSTLDNGADSFDLSFANIRALDEAERQAKLYFAGTNVLSWCHVAIHDDDLFEDMGDVFYKDPIFLRELAPIDPPDFSDRCLDWGRVGFRVLAWLLAPRGITINGLVNREIEIVKLVVPLAGANRADPVEDPCAPSSYVPSAETATGFSVERRTLYARRLTAALGGATADWMPRQFVVYVKQRLVWMDLVFRLADAISDLAEAVGATLADVAGNEGAEDDFVASWEPVAASFQLPSTGEEGDTGGAAYMEIDALREVLASRPLRAIGVLRGAWDQLWAIPPLRQSAARAAAESISGFGDLESWATYQRLIKTGGRDEAIENMIQERRVEGWLVLKAMTLVLREQQVADFEAEVYDSAAYRAEHCPPDEPEPEPDVPTLTCEAIQGRVENGLLDPAFGEELCCSLFDEPIAVAIVAEVLDLLGQTTPAELPERLSTSTETVAAILLVNDDEAERKLMLEWVMRHDNGAFCDCMARFTRAAAALYAPEGAMGPDGEDLRARWLAFTADVGVGTLDRELGLDCLALWVAKDRFAALQVSLESYVAP